MPCLYHRLHVEHSSELFSIVKSFVVFYDLLCSSGGGKQFYTYDV